MSSIFSNTLKKYFISFASLSFIYISIFYISGYEKSKEIFSYLCFILPTFVSMFLIFYKSPIKEFQKLVKNKYELTRSCFSCATSFSIGSLVIGYFSYLFSSLIIQCSLYLDSLSIERFYELLLVVFTDFHLFLFSTSLICFILTLMLIFNEEKISLIKHDITQQ